MNANTQTVDERCADWSNRAMRCARNDGANYGPEFARVLVCKRLASNIIALRTNEAREQEVRS